MRMVVKTEGMLNGTINNFSDNVYLLPIEWETADIRLTQPRFIVRWVMDQRWCGGESVDDGKMNTLHLTLQG